MNIYRYEFEYKVYNSNGLEVDKGIETSKGYDEVRAENYLRTRLEEGCQSDEEVELKLIPSFVKYTDANKLIAEFMGLDSFKDSLASLYQGKINIDIDVYEQAQYHTSWDWLMPVVEKIENTNLFPTTENAVNVTIGATLYCLIQDNYGEKFEIVGQGKTKLLSVYQAVVEFINFYNKNNK